MVRIALSLLKTNTHMSGTSGTNDDAKKRIKKKNTRSSRGSSTCLEEGAALRLSDRHVYHALAVEQAR